MKVRKAKKSKVFVAVTILVFLLLIIIGIMVIPKTYAATTEDGLFTYTVANDCVTITYYHGEGDDNVVIPSEIGGYPVTAISANLSNYIDTVYIPSSVLKISIYEHKYETSLTNINVDEENPNYSSNNGILFNKDQTKIIWYPADREETEYEIPESITEIGDYAFLTCDNLLTINLPNGLTKIR